MTDPPYRSNVRSVLQTAAPPSWYNAYTAHPSIVVNSLESGFAAGSIPAWFQSLPTPVQTYIIGGGGLASISPSSAASATGKRKPTSASTTKIVASTAKNNGSTAKSVSAPDPSTSSSQTTSSTSSPTRTPSPGLSTGAAAGIGVGATIAGVIVLGLLVWCLRKNFKISRRDRGTPQYSEHEKRMSEMIHASPQELHGTARAGELDATHQIGELDAGYPGIEAGKGVRSPR
jgi:hypothetical protein